MSNNNPIVSIPEEYLPEIAELPGDLRRIAQAMAEHYAPAEAVRIATLLGQLFPGIPLYMHNVNKLLLTIRDDAIRAERDGGASVKELAIRYRRSTRQIENIIGQDYSRRWREKEAQERQGRLF